MPFRLTRNLQTFFTPFGVEGVFITGLSVAAMVGCSGIALLGSAWAAFVSRLEGGVIDGLSMAGAHTSTGLRRLWHVLACQCSQSYLSSNLAQPAPPHQAA